MAELVPAPFKDLVTRLFAEPAVQDSLFDLPSRSWYAPPARTDLSVEFHGGRAGTPVGPASGPHTQMAQNLVLAYAAGSRIMEFKTVQINDRLTIPRPCIDMANVGYNVEWSQELLLEESLREYVAGMMLVEMFRHLVPQAPDGLAGKAGEVIYDISLGYDLAGITSGKIQRYLDGIRDARKVIATLKEEIPARYAGARDLEYSTCISNTLTLSTFHGCPTDEIEKICEFLLGERGLDVIVKMNPPTIGRERLEHLLHDLMGYTDIRVRPEAYTSSQTFDEALEMTGRLRDYARNKGRRFGCKFSNTLEVINHKPFFPPGNEVMYLSGAPLHVITLALAAEFMKAMGPGLPISFSAGIDAQNFASAVACGFVPVTTCSDLLKTGGYGRLPAYLTSLAREMEAHDADSVDSYILKVFGNEEKARELAGVSADAATVVAHAAILNTQVAAEMAQANPRYHADKNRREPKRIDSHLVLFDCLTCDKCIPVCPNDANFIYPAPNVEFEVHDIHVTSDGWRRGESSRVFRITRKHQIANYGEFCNECGNCDTFCPEYGGPYIEKPTFYRTIESYTAAAPRDAFVVTGTPSRGSIRGRIEGHEYTLDIDESVNHARFASSRAELVLRLDNHEPQSAGMLHEDESAILDMCIYHSMIHLFRGVLDPSRINQINVGNAV